MKKFLKKEEFARVLRCHLRNVGDKTFDAMLNGIEEYLETVACAAIKARWEDEEKKTVVERQRMYLEMQHEWLELISMREAAEEACEKYCAAAEEARNFLNTAGKGLIEAGDALIKEALAARESLPKVVPPSPDARIQELTERFEKKHGIDWPSGCSGLPGHADSSDCEKLTIRGISGGVGRIAPEGVDGIGGSADNSGPTGEQGEPGCMKPNSSQEKEREYERVKPAINELLDREPAVLESICEKLEPSEDLTNFSRAVEILYRFHGERIDSRWREVSVRNACKIVAAMAEPPQQFVLSEFVGDEPSRLVDVLKRFVKFPPQAILRASHERRFGKG